MDPEPVEGSTVGLVLDAKHSALQLAHPSAWLLPERPHSPDTMALMTIRPELPSEYTSVEQIHLLSFSQAFEGAGPYEAGVVARIRQSKNFVPELSLVAIEDNQPVGHILFSYIGLQDETDTLRRCMVLAPLAIHPDHQNKGIGTALVYAGLEKLESRLEPLVIVRGHPSYYPRFGFVPSVKLSIRPPFEIAEEAYMVKALKAYSPEYRGVVVYPAAFAR